MRSRYVLRAAAGLAVICAAAIPATAYAAGTITITFAGNPASSEPTILQVDATASTPINSLTAELMSAPDGTDEYDVTSFTFASGSPDQSSGTWTATVPAGAVPAGTYTVSVTAGDTGGDTYTDADAGTFGFLNQPTLTASSDVSAVSYGSQSVTFAGSLTATPAGGGTAIAEGSVPIYYAGIGQTTGTLLTDTESDGTFSATVNNLLGGDYTLSADASSTMAAAQSNLISIDDNFASTSITEMATPASVKYGASVTLTGTATYAVGSGTSQPLGNYPVAIMAGNTALPSVQTNNLGQYTATVPSTDGNSFTVTTGAGNYLLNQSSNSASVTVQLPISVQSFSAKLEPLGTVQSTACLKINAGPAYGTTPSFGKVELEYSAKSGGPWKQLGNLRFNNSVSANCARAGGEFLTDDNNSQGYFRHGILSAKLVSSYYRIAFSGGTNYQSFASAPVHSSLDRTRFTGFSVSPRSLRSGGYFHVSGTLWKQAKRWEKYGRRKIGIFFYNKSQGLVLAGTTWTTRNGGHFDKALRFSGAGRAQMLAIYLGDSTHLWSESSKVRFSVYAGVNAPASRLSVLGSAGSLGAGIRALQSAPSLAR